MNRETHVSWVLFVDALRVATTKQLVSALEDAVETEAQLKIFHVDRENNSRRS